MNKLILKHPDIRRLTSSICRELSSSDWKPDYVVGITRGGLIPAVMISHWFEIPMYALGVNLRDNTDDQGPESNLWMAEDAFGYPKQEITVDETNIENVFTAADELLSAGDNFKNILIVDDINDSGATFNWIMNDWRSGCLPNDPEWDNVWNNNVKFAVLVDNLASKCNVKMDFCGMEINKAENDVWVDFPWEEWWAK